ncbi:NUMOD3 domain-containing DNA-binding protein, partial [Romboutsia sp.]|uniref:NUMOD3 domain-containing DNA-binding protein n=1 Tax=Romboutsia sp. TaxID=1965302 RepID=UPI003F338CA0
RRNQYFINIINKEKDNVSVRLYKENLTDKEACDLEIKRIEYYRSINQAKTNFHNGGVGGHTGNYHSKDRSDKLSKLMKERNLSGERNPMYGKTHSLEARLKISITHKGKVISEEHRKQISKKLKNTVASEEKREKCRIKSTGVVFTQERKDNISKALIKNVYTVAYNDEFNEIPGKVNLYKFMTNKYSLSKTVTDKILNNCWDPKFKRHLKYETLKIIETEIKCID